jgi:hypothetical protein
MMSHCLIINYDYIRVDVDCSEDVNIEDDVDVDGVD